ncbi:universal stress protein [Microbacterium sp. ASV49]|uniref:Universal stress protein n=1 Tax=Microbacterium candidum TaxID=3041922 RepID=A0ABT7MUR1_9MICO|nr:universal stress protein [Microbacterium sp. ASV49]MDL9978184.1 universal stress protein [Microbacterium sp. ASV49]
MSLLVGVNPGHRSASVLHLAAMLARSAGTDLIVAAVVPQTWPPSAARVDAEWQSYARDTANTVLDHAAAVLGDSVRAEYLLVEASSARRGLLELAEARGAELIVVGSSSAGSFGHVALGSVSDALLHASPVPVAVAPRGFRTRGQARVGRVTAAYGGTDAAADLVIGAAGIAAQVGASLRIASFAVAPAVSGTSRTGIGSERGVIDEWANEIGEHTAQLLSDVSALPNHPESAEAVVGLGDSWAAAIEDIEWNDDDVLVVGSSSLGPVARVFLGSHATKVVRHSPVPVVVVPRRQSEELAARAEFG